MANWTSCLRGKKDTRKVEWDTYSPQEDEVQHEAHHEAHRVWRVAVLVWVEHVKRREDGNLDSDDGVEQSERGEV